MAFATWLRKLRTGSKDNLQRRTSRRNISSKKAIVKLGMERLEERMVLSGFGPQDAAYIVEPWSGRYSDVKIQPGDQKIVAAGTMTITNADNTTQNRMAVARYDSLGNGDATYGSGGLTGPALGPSHEQGLGLVLQSDGKAIVSGQNSANAALAVARFTPNGSLDSSFGSSGWTSFDVRANYVDYANSVGLQATGKVVVAGWSMASNSSAAVAARFKANGLIDSGKGAFGQVVNGKATGYSLNTFGMMHNSFKDLAVQQDDKVVAVGYAYDRGNNMRLVLARYTANGTLDMTFNGSGYSLLAPAGISSLGANDVALQSNGKIVVVGTSTSADGDKDMFVARYNPNGTLDPSFGGGSGYVRLDIDGNATITSEQANGVAIQPDGKIMISRWRR